MSVTVHDVWVCEHHLWFPPCICEPSLPAWVTNVFTIVADVPCCMRTPSHGNYSGNVTCATLLLLWTSSFSSKIKTTFRDLALLPSWGKLWWILQKVPIRTRGLGSSPSIVSNSCNFYLKTGGEPAPETSFPFLNLILDEVQKSSNVELNTSLELFGVITWLVFARPNAEKRRGKTGQLTQHIYRPCKNLLTGTTKCFSDLTPAAQYSGCK